MYGTFYDIMLDADSITAKTYSSTFKILKKTKQE